MEGWKEEFSLWYLLSLCNAAVFLWQTYGPSHLATRFIWLMMWPISLEPRVGISLSFSSLSLPSFFRDHSKLLLSYNFPAVVSQCEIIATELSLSYPLHCTFLCNMMQEIYDFSHCLKKHH